MAKLEPEKGFATLLIATILVYFVGSLGILDLTQYGINLPPLVSVFYLYIIVFGLILLSSMILGPRPTNRGMAFYFVLALILVALYMFLPQILPPDFAVITRSAQSALGMG